LEDRAARALADDPETVDADGITRYSNAPLSDSRQLATQGGLAMRPRGLKRYAPLTGVAFVVLLILAIVIGGSTPDNNDSLRKIVNFWHDNKSAQQWSALVGAWAIVFFVWFAATVRSVLRRLEEGPSRLSAISFGGALIGATGLLSSLSLSFGAADSVNDVPGEVTRTLTVLSNEFFFPIAAGYGLFFLAAGILAVGTRALPAWLGWPAVVIGIVCLTPVGFFALLLGLVWTFVASILLYLREGASAAGPGPRVEPPAPAGT
jgi:hypothetical protein